VSRDIFVQDLPKEAETVGEIPSDFEPRSLGPSKELVRRIQVAVPEANFSDTEWGVIDGPGSSIEVNIRESNAVQAFALHVRGDASADEIIARILSGLELRALDPDSPTGFFRGPG